MKPSRFQTRGTTFTEMLVAITIILSAVAMVTPAYYGMRRGAQRMACINTLSQIAAGMTIYAKNFDEWIIGSPHGSGAYLASETQAWGSAVQTWDFMGPLETQWDMGLPTVSKGGSTDEAVAKRFNELRGHYAFKCAGNDWLAPKYAGSMIDAGVGPMVSYNTQRLQLTPADGWTGGGGWGHTPPSGWRPSTLRIGSPSNKIFCGDGARYSTCIDPPDYDLTCAPSLAGAFSDGGAYSAYSRSWDRCRAPGNAGAPGGHDLTDVDARQYAFRHSTGSPPPGAAGNAYKGNFAFYDGHVETLGDLDASSPFLWLPKGTVIEPASAEIWPDTMSYFGLGSTVEIGP